MILKKYLFIFDCTGSSLLCTASLVVVIRVFSVVVISRASHHSDFPFLQSRGSTARGLSCSLVYGIFSDQGSNPCPLLWQADSQPLYYQGSPLLIFFFFKFFFYWKVIALQNFVVFWHESVIGIHISPRFWTSLPFPSPSHPSRLIQSSCLSFLRHTANSHWLSILHVVMKVSMLLFTYISPSLSLSPCP